MVYNLWKKPLTRNSEYSSVSSDSKKYINLQFKKIKILFNNVSLKVF